MKKFLLIFLSASLLLGFNSTAQLTGASVDAVTNITHEGVTLNGEITTSGTIDVDYYFNYGTTSGSLTTQAPNPATTLADLDGTQSVDEAISGLSAETQYFYELYAEETVDNTQTATSTEGSFWTYSEVTETAVSSFQRQSATTNSITLEWAELTTDISGYIIVYNASGTAPDETDLQPGAAPSDLTYTNKVIVNDPTVTSIVIEGLTDGTPTTPLTPNTQYSFRIIPYNVGSDPETTNYKLTGNTTLSTYTLENVTAATIDNFDIRSKGENNIELEWTAETTDNDGYLILWAEGPNAPVPADVVVLGIRPDDQPFSNNIVRTGSSSNSQNINTGLDPGKEYSFVIIPYNRGDDDLTTNYNITTNSEVSTFTLAEEPSNNASSPTFISSTSSSITLEFAKSDGATPADGYFITYQEGTSAPGNPGAIDGTDGSSESGEADVDGTFTIFSTDATISATIPSLSAGTEYSFRIMAFSEVSNDPSSRNYKTNGITFQGNNLFTLATEPTSAITGFEKVSATKTQIDFTFDEYPPFDDNGGFVLYYQEGSSAPDLSNLENGLQPSEQTNAAITSLFYTVQNTDDATSVSTSGNIEAGHEYSAILVPFNFITGDFETINYGKAAAKSLTSVWSIAEDASGGAVADGGYTVNNPTSNSLDIAYAAVTDANGYLILYSEGNSAFDISDVEDGFSPTQIEASLPTGVLLVDNGTDLTRTIGSLEADTDHSFYVIPYTFAESAGSPVDETYNYNTASPILKGGTTLCSTGPLAGSASIANDAAALTSSSIKTDLSNVPAGAENLVVARLQSDAAQAPVDGTSYTANAEFGTGDQTGAGNDVVLVGTATTVTTTELSPFTDYAFDYYVYNPNGNCYTFVETIEVKTDCQPATATVSSASADQVNSNDVSLSWTITGTNELSNSNNVLVVARLTDSTTPEDPTTGDSYSADSEYGSGAEIGAGTGNFVVYDGAGGSVTVTGLDALTNYSFDIYEYNPIGLCYNLTSEPVTIDASTICEAPTSQADFSTFDAFTDQTATTATINWPTVASADRYLVLANETGTVAFTPENGSNYESEDNLDFIQATDKGGGDKVIYAGAHPGAAVTVTNLIPGTAYNFVIYAYNTLNDCYNLVSPGTLDITTNAPSANNTLSIVSEAPSINSIGNDVNNAFVTALSFNMIDGGVDGANTRLSGFTISAGAGDYFESQTTPILWSEVIASAEFRNTTTNVSKVATISGTDNEISVTIGSSENNNTSSFGYIADDGTINMELRIKLRDDISGIQIDNKNFSFELDPSSISYFNDKSSTFSSGTITSDPNNNEIVVEASKFTFTTQPPTTIDAGENMLPRPIFEARDANDNIDLDFSSTFVVSNTGGIDMGNAPTAGFTNGVHTFPNNFNYQGSGNGRLTVTSGGISGTSGPVTVVPTSAFTELTTGLNAGILKSEAESSNQAVLGFSIEVLGTNTFNQLVINIDEPLSNKVDNVRLVRSSDNNYDGIGSETLITSTVNIGAGTITFTGFTEDFDSEVKNYFIVVDVDNSVSDLTDPLTFSLDETDISFASTISKGSLAASRLYNFEDEIRPSIEPEIVASPTLLSDSDADDVNPAITFTLTYDEAMDPTISPSLTFPTTGENPGTSLVYLAGSSEWSDGNTVFTAVYRLNDNGIDIRDIDVRVSGADDRSGNLQNVYDEADVFGIDTENPTVEILTTSPTLLNIDNNILTLTATFSEPMSTSAGATPNFTISNNAPASFTENGNGTWSDGNTVYTQSFIQTSTVEVTQAGINIEVSEAEDVNGNISVANTSDNFAIDTERPRIEEITSPNDDILYGPGAEIIIVVKFDENIEVTGAPFLTLNTGGGGTAAFESFSGSVATFKYTVGAVGSGQNTLDLDVSGVTLDGGSIEDVNANDAVLDLPDPADRLQNNSGISVDTEPAVITNVTATTDNGFYNEGDIIDITITFDEPVTVGGAPTLALNSGGSATYHSGSSTSTLTFRYTVLAGQNAADLNYNATNSLTLSGGSIKDNAQINAILTLPATTAGTSLGGNKNITIDTVDPLLAGTPFSPNTGTLNVSQTFTFAISLNEAALGAGSSNIRLKELETGDVVTTLDGSTAFTNAPNATLNFVNLDAFIQDSTEYYFEFDAGAITDRAGNPFAGFSSSGDWNFTSAGPARISDFSTGACVGEEFTIGGKYFTGVTQIVTGNSGDSTYYNIGDNDFEILDDENIRFNVKIETYSGKIVLKKISGESGNTRDFKSISSEDIVVGPSSAQFEIVSNEFVCDVSAGGSQDEAELRINVVGGSGVYKVIYNNGEEDITIEEYTSGNTFFVDPPEVGLNNYTLVSVTDTDEELLTCSAPNLGTPVVVEEFQRSVVEAGGGSTDPDLNIGLIQICAADTEIVDFSDPAIVGTVASIVGSESAGTWTIVGGNASSGGFNESRTMKSTTTTRPTYYISLDDAIRGQVILELTSDDPGGNNPCAPASDRVVIRFINSLQANPAQSTVSICKIVEDSEELAITQLDAVLADGTTEIEWSRNDLYNEEGAEYDNSWGFADTEDASTFTLTTNNPQAYYKASPLELANDFARLRVLATDGFCGEPGDPVGMDLIINDVPAPEKSNLPNVNPQNVCSGDEGIIFGMNTSSNNARFIWELSNSDEGSITEGDISTINSPSVEDGIYLSIIELAFREVNEFTSDTLIVREIRNGCLSEPDSFFINIAPTPIAEILTGPSASINNTTTRLELTGQGGYEEALEEGGIFEGQGVFQGSNGNYFLNTTELMPTDITNPDDNYTLTYTYTTELGCSASTSVEFDVFNADNIFAGLDPQYCELDSLIEITVNNIIIPDGFIVTDIFGPGISNFEVEEIRTDTSLNIYTALFNPKAALDSGQNLNLANVLVGYATQDTVNNITNEEAGSQGVIVNALPQTDPTGLAGSYCATDGNAQLSKGISNPNSEFSYSVITQGLPTNLLRLDTTNGNYVLAPSILYDSLFDNNISAVEVELLYTYRDLNGCENSEVLSTVINRQPAQPTFDNTNFCILNGEIPEATVNNPTASAGEILWYSNQNLVGEPLEIGSTYTPSATVVQNNTTQLFVVRRADNCISEVTTVTFRRQIDPSFAWDKSVNSEGGITFTGIDAQAGIASVNWIIKKKGASIPLVDSTLAAGNLTFDQDFSQSGAGIYEVTFRIESQFGCVTSKTDDVTVLLEAPKASNYIYDFNETNDNWITSGENSSWELAEPEVGFDNESAFWVTNASGNYNPNEDSYVYSPEFDLNDVDRPVVSFDLWLNTVSSDGLVIEYSTDEFKVEDDEKVWTKLGAEGSGLNWYNTNNLSSIAFFEGWSGIFDLDDSSMKLNCKHSLDPVLNDNQRNKVIFRFHFKSINSSPTDGVAFDNFKIESLNRNVLVEYFGDYTSDNDVREMNTINQEFNTTGGFSWINYRINQEDTLYKQQSSPMLSRMYFYDAYDLEDQFSTDGEIREFNFSGDNGDAGSNDLSRTRLFSSPINFDLLDVSVDEDELKIDVSFESVEPIEEDVNLYIAVLQKEISGSIEGVTYYNVLRKLLPGNSGIDVSGTSGQQTVTFKATSPSDEAPLAVVAFLQNVDTREVLQSAYIDGFPELSFSIITANEKELNNLDIMLFPNPARDFLNIQWNTPLQQQAKAKVIDITGKIIKEFNLEKGEQYYELNTSPLKTGMYNLILSNQEGEQKRLKFAVTN